MGSDAGSGFEGSDWFANNDAQGKGQSPCHSRSCDAGPLQETKLMDHILEVATPVGH